MKYPKFISENSLIGIPCPSGGSTKETKVNKYKNVIKRLESLGFKLKISDYIYNNEMGRSTNAKNRSKEFNNMLTEVMAYLEKILKDESGIEETTKEKEDDRARAMFEKDIKD